jgi:uncharacterized protein
VDHVVHFEIPVSDIDQAVKFYEQAFGWQISQDQMPDGSTYTSAVTTPVDEQQQPQKPGAINGALIERNDTFTAPVVTVDVDSVEDAISKVESAGGKALLPKASIPGMGEYAYVTDPSGNVVGLWRSY